MSFYWFWYIKRFLVKGTSRVGSSNSWMCFYSPFRLKKGYYFYFLFLVFEKFLIAPRYALLGWIHFPSLSRSVFLLVNLYPFLMFRSIFKVLKFYFGNWLFHYHHFFSILVLPLNEIYNFMSFFLRKEKIFLYDQKKK